MSAALYASRSNLKTVIIEKAIPGGELNNTSTVENYPGYESIEGSDLADRMYKSSMQFGAEHIFGEVSEISLTNNKKYVKMGSVAYETKVIILATGAEHKKLGIVGEDTYEGKGISRCSVCEGLFFTGRDVIVVGGGDSAVEEADYLTNYANSVTIVHRRDKLRAQPTIKERAFSNPKIDFIWNSEVKEILGDATVNGVLLENSEGELHTVEVDGVFVYIGMYPNTTLVDGLGVTDEEGWVITNENMETSVKGIYAVGDVRAKKLRQIVTATGDGAQAAQEAYNYIQKLKEND